ncbi:MAG: deoxyribodipyrimidine photo-lyase [Planctomycetota bacterium]
MAEADRQHVQPDRNQPIGRGWDRTGDYVLYWMQASQRAEWNHALEYAIAQANQRSVPVVACFGLTDGYPQANARHYLFMLQGLSQTSRRLADRGVQLVVRKGHPPQVAADLAGAAGLVVVDRGYLRHQRTWRKDLAEQVEAQVVQVESDVVVPIETASNKEEYAARTIRPKIHRHLEDYLVQIEPAKPGRDSLDLDLGGLDVSDPQALLDQLDVDVSVAPSRLYPGGRSEAERLLAEFSEQKLSRYADERSEPGEDIQSHMSPFLHFGQISPLEIALRVRQADARQEAKDAFLEELIVRRELGINFVAYNSHYDSYAHLPEWAQATLEYHKHDDRENLYTAEQLEKAQTHDEYWNAAMREMVVTGKMHNYMRMYWGKKIIEWSNTPQQAYRTALELNNRYFLDGRDPLSFSNVAWLFGKHDRPWQERAIFGKVRYMNAAGLERKFDMKAYLDRVEALIGRQEGGEE